MKLALLALLAVLAALLLWRFNDPDTVRREDYLRAHPDTEARTWTAIRRGGVVHGMSLPEVEASIGRVVLTGGGITGRDWIRPRIRAEGRAAKDGRLLSLAWDSSRGEWFTYAALSGSRGYSHGSRHWERSVYR